MAHIPDPPGVSDSTSQFRPTLLRIWPGVAVVALQWLIRFAVPSLFPEATVYAVITGVFGGLAVVVWWTLFSRAPWSERLGALALAAAAWVVTPRFVHPSIANGMMGGLFLVYAVPLLSLAFVASVVATRRLSTGVRRVSMATAILLGCGAMTVVRTGGVTGGADSDFHWRWTATPEERLLAQTGHELVASPAPAAMVAAEPTVAPSVTPAPAPTAAKPPENAAPSPAVPTPAAPSSDATLAKARADWPGFRGAGRDGIVRGVRLDTNWTQSPPVELWRRSIGPGWSSFAVRGNLVYTQEQRGDEEVVSAYRLDSGEPVWRHADAVRFWESNGGAGPRATPSVRDGRVYTFGATGIVNALDAGTGAVVWSRNAATDANRKVPMWGFASSPLVTDDLVILAAGGQLVAYDIATGEPRWLGPAGGAAYSSPQIVTIDDVAQIVLLNGGGATGVAPADGTLLWQHPWQPAVGFLQPALAGNGDVLITGGEGITGIGMRRVALVHGSAGWTVEERWTSSGLKPFFNDFVVHRGHAFGFDGSILACIDLEDGARRWKGGRYGHGQLVLLPDQDAMLVLSEEGELALVQATPDRFTELARFTAIEGKTWNHPVLVGDVVLVRNGEEMAAFRLSLAGR